MSNCIICGRESSLTAGCPYCMSQQFHEWESLNPNPQYYQGTIKQSPIMSPVEISLNDILNRLERIETAISSLKASKSQE